MSEILTGQAPKDIEFRFTAGSSDTGSVGGPEYRESGSVSAREYSGRTSEQQLRPGAPEGPSNTDNRIEDVELAEELAYIEKPLRDKAHKEGNLASKLHYTNEAIKLGNETLEDHRKYVKAREEGK